MADFPPCDDVCGTLEQHVRNFFDGREIQAFTWPPSPILEHNPHFRVLRVAPSSPKQLWTYVSVGGWAATGAKNVGTEFILCTATEDIRAVELLAMTVYYHEGGKLGLGHTLPLGEPWMAGSQCDYFLVSLPYPFGPDLEIAHVGDRHVEFLWLLPITKAERDHKIADGLEALESRFEEAGLRYWEINRASIV